MDCDEPVNYCSTVIKKVIIDGKKPLSDVNFLKSIQKDDDQDCFDECTYEVNESHMDIDDETENRYSKCLRSRYTRLKQRGKEHSENELPIIKKQAITNKEHQNNCCLTDPDYEAPSINKKKYQIQASHIKKGERIHSKQKNIQALQISGKNKKNFIVLSNPIKPVYLQDYTIVAAKKRKKINKKKDKGPHICPYCGKMTKYLQTHLLVHSEVKPFKGDQCTREYPTESRLQMHKKIAHGPKKFKCAQCSAAFTSKAILKRHILSHSQLTPHYCNLCNKPFKLEYQLKRHVANMHVVAIKDWKCEQCPDTFSTHFGLKTHMRVHTRERPYRCEICSQPYSYKPDFNRHCLKKHGVWFKRRSVYVLNEEVLAQEKVLMRDIVLRTNGVLKEDKPVHQFDGPQGVMAYSLMVEAIQTGKLLVDL